MEKDFQKWHRQKAAIDRGAHWPFFREGDVWLCRVGVNVGFEQDSRGDDFLRPVIVLRKFNQNIFWAIPLTRARKFGDYYFEFSFNNGGVSVAILSQIRLIDAKRLSHRIGIISGKDLGSLKQKLRALLP